MIRTLAWMGLSLLTTTTGLSGAPLDEGLPMGPYGVGWQVRQLSDPARPLEDGRPRPMQIAVWYPADTEGTPASVYRDYMWLLLGERGLTDTTSVQEQWEERVEPYLQNFHRRGVDREAIERWLDHTVAAHRDAPAVEGSFPLVLLAQGNSHSVHNQAILAACLASRGYVVASAPAPGRITRPAQSEEEVLPSAEEQADDLQFLLTMAGDLPGAPVGVVGVLGYSFGGRSALLFQMETGAASAMVSLDSGIANVMGKGLLEKASYFSPDRFAIPLLHVYQSGDAMVQPDFELIEGLGHSDRTLIELGGLAHGHFGSLGWVAARTQGFSSLLPEEGDVEAAWLVMVESVGSFLDATLRGTDGGSFTPPAGGPVRSARRIAPVR